MPQNFMISVTFNQRKAVPTCQLNEFLMELHYDELRMERQRGIMEKLSEHPEFEPLDIELHPLNFRNAMP